MQRSCTLVCAWRRPQGLLASPKMEAPEHCRQVVINLWVVLAVATIKVALQASCIVGSSDYVVIDLLLTYVIDLATDLRNCWWCACSTWDSRQKLINATVGYAPCRMAGSACKDALTERHNTLDHVNHNQQCAGVVVLFMQLFACVIADTFRPYYNGITDCVISRRCCAI